jgi:hypothetical protein
MEPLAIEANVSPRFFASGLNAKSTISSLLILLLVSFRFLTSDRVGI